MKVTLEFNLPEESEEHKLALYGAKYSSAVDEVFNWIRSQLKYNETLTEDQTTILESLRSHLNEYIDTDKF